MLNLYVKKLSSKAVVPTKGSEYSAGMDLYSVEDYEIPAGGMAKVKTGLAIQLPSWTFGAIYPRSGLATKQGLRLCNCVGVVDSDYRGEVIVPLYNDSQETRYVKAGDRIAQLVVQQYEKCFLVETDDLDETERGSGGFGSTGTN